MHPFTFPTPQKRSLTASFSTFDALCKAVSLKASKGASKSTTTAALEYGADMTSKKEKKKVLPYKQPTSSYLFFSVEYFAKHKDQWEHKPISERVSETSKAWKSLSAIEKIPYETKSAKDRERYFAEKKRYEATLPPKKPLSAFLLFFDGIRAQLRSDNPDTDVKNIARLAGEKWSNLSVDEKEKYFSSSRKALEAWKKQHGKRVN